MSSVCFVLIFPLSLKTLFPVSFLLYFYEIKFICMQHNIWECLSCRKDLYRGYYSFMILFPSLFIYIFFNFSPTLVKQVLHFYPIYIALLLLFKERAVAVHSWTLPSIDRIYVGEAFSILLFARYFLNTKTVMTSHLKLCESLCPSTFLDLWMSPFLTNSILKRIPRNFCFPTNTRVPRVIPGKKHLWKNIPSKMITHTQGGKKKHEPWKKNMDAFKERCYIFYWLNLYTTYLTDSGQLYYNCSQLLGKILFEGFTQP